MPTHVLRDCELCGKFTFIFRRKFSSNRKYSFTKLATSQSVGTLAEIFGERRRKQERKDI